MGVLLALLLPFILCSFINTPDCLPFSDQHAHLFSPWNSPRHGAPKHPTNARILRRELNLPPAILHHRAPCCFGHVLKLFGCFKRKSKRHPFRRCFALCPSLLLTLALPRCWLQIVCCIIDFLSFEPACWPGLLVPFRLCGARTAGTQVSGRP